MITNIRKTNPVPLLAVVFVLSLFAYTVLAKNDAITGQEHQSNVAKVAQELRKLAGQAQNIGTEIREVAKEQEDSAEKVEAAMDIIGTRGGFKTLLLGTDYKNIGAIRSELVTTQNAIERLTRAVAKATSADVKAELEKQITALKETKSKVEAFIKEHESQFSIFGWFIKLFNR